MKILVFGGTEEGRVLTASLCALGAEGESAVTDAGHILRGYESLEGALRSLGASVWREER